MWEIPDSLPTLALSTTNVQGKSAIAKLSKAQEILEEFISGHSKLWSAPL
jgi:hypothetical protein